MKGDLLDIEAEIALDGDDSVGLIVRGVPVTFDAKKSEITCRGTTAPLRPRDGKISLRVLADRGSIEVFGNDGEVAISQAVIPADDHTLKAFAAGGPATFRSLVVHELKSAWPKP